MVTSIIFADVVIAHIAARAIISFTTFLNIVFLIIQGSGFALKSTVVEDVLTFVLGMWIEIILLGYWSSEGALESGYEPARLLPEEEARTQENVPVLDSMSYQDSSPEQNILPVQIDSPNPDNQLLPDIPPSQEDLPLRGDSDYPSDRICQDDSSSEDNESYEDDPLIQDTSFQDIIESEQDRRKLRNSMARLKRRISYVPFIREPGRPVRRSYLLSYTTVLAFDTLCLWFWIQNAIYFPWDKHRVEMEMRGGRNINPNGTIALANDTFLFVRGESMKNMIRSNEWNREDQIRNWSAWWWPSTMLEVFNLLIFPMIYTAEWSLLVWPLALWWRGFRSNARNQRPRGRRVIIASQTELTHLDQDEEQFSDYISQFRREQYLDIAELPEQEEMSGVLHPSEDEDGIELVNLNG